MLIKRMTPHILKALESFQFSISSEPAPRQMISLSVKLSVTLRVETCNAKTHICSSGDFVTSNSLQLLILRFAKASVRFWQGLF
jgi:hypothetical protein